MRYLFMKRRNIRKILKEYIEHSSNGLKDSVDYAQEKATKNT